MAKPAEVTPPAEADSFGAALEAALSAAPLSSAAPDPAVPVAEVIAPPVAAVVPEVVTPAAAAATTPKLPSATKKTAPAADADEPPAGLDEKAGNKWKEIRENAKAAATRAEAAEARALAAEEKLKGFDPDEIANLRKRSTEQESELSISRVEATKEYKDAVTVPIGQVVDAAKALAKRYNLPERDVVSALQETDADKQSELLQGLAATLGTRDQSRLFRMGDDMLMLNGRKDLIIGNAAETLKRIELKRTEQIAAFETGSKAEQAAAYDGVWNNLKTQSDFFNVDAEGVDPDHKAAITEAVKIARGLHFETLAPQQKAFAAYAGAHFPYLMKVIGALQTENEGLVAERAKLRASAPGAGGGGAGAPIVAGDENLDFGVGMEAAMAAG